MFKLCYVSGIHHVVFLTRPSPRYEYCKRRWLWWRLEDWVQARAHDDVVYTGLESDRQRRRYDVPVATPERGVATRDKDGRGACKDASVPNDVIRTADSTHHVIAYRWK